MDGNSEVCSSACRFHTRLVQNILAESARKNLALTRKVSHMSKRSTREKLLSYLSGQALGAGSDAFEIPFNRQQLADYLSVDRSAMSGELCRMRDEGLLESALMRPQNIVAYADAGQPPDVAALAASYGVGLAKNHPFVDGNKRTAFLAVGLFLYLNGMRLQASQTDATLTMLAVAAGDISEEAFAAWLRAHAVARG